MQCYERQGKTKQCLINQRINYDSKDVEFEFEFIAVICVDITGCWYRESVYHPKKKLLSNIGRIKVAIKLLHVIIRELVVNVILSYHKIKIRFCN